MAGKDFYKILGVSKDASPEKIKRAYKELSKRYHPDRNQNDPSAEAKFKDVQQAYNVLKDPKKREDYDLYGDVAVGDFRTGANGQRVYQWGGGSQVNVEDLQDLFSSFGWSGETPHSQTGRRGPSIFEQFFGGGRHGSATSQSVQRGSDLEKPLRLTWRQSALGTIVTVNLQIGQDTRRTESLEVKIPAGVEQGQKIRLRGKGHRGSGGGPPGDLILVCNIEPHPYFWREGADVYLEVPITPTEAVLGAKIDVPSLEGSSIVTLPPGTTSGTKLRLRSRGVVLPGQGEPGDQYCVIKIVPPPNLTDEEKVLFEQLRSLEQHNPRSDLGWPMREAIRN